MSDQNVGPGAMSILKNAAADSGRVMVPITLGSLAPLDPLIAQLLVAGYLRLVKADEEDSLPPDRLIYEVTELGREALDSAGE